MRKLQYSIASMALGVLVAAGAVTACSDSGGGGGTGGTGGSSTGGKTGTGGSSGSGGSTAGSGGTTGGTGNAGAGGTVGGAAGQGGSAGKAGSAGAGGGGSAKIRLVHASSNAGPVDVYLKGIPTAVASLEYGAAINYVSVPSGKYVVELRKKGDAATAPALFTSAELVVDADKKYTAVAAGLLNSPKNEDQLRILRLTDSWLPILPSLKVRLLNASPDTPNVDINVNDDAGVPEIANLKLFADTGEPGLDWAAATALQLGIKNGETALTAFTTPNDWAASSGLLIIAAGLAGKAVRAPDALALLVVLPDGKTVWVRQNPRLFALHASPDLGAADVYSGTREIIDNASFGALANVQLPPGEYTLDLFAGQAGPTTRPVGDAVFSAPTPKLEAGKVYLATVAGKNADKTVALVAQEEGFLLSDTTNARLRTVLASSNAAAVDVGIVETTGNIKTPPLLTNLKFKDASPPEGLVFVPAESSTLGFAATGGSATLAEFKLPKLTAAQRAFAIVAGDATGGSNPLQLFYVDATNSVWASTKIANSKP